MSRARLTDDEFGLLASLDLSEDGLDIAYLSSAERGLANVFERRGLVRLEDDGRKLRVTDEGRRVLSEDGS